MKPKKRILFVGSFKAPLDGRIGGQYFACKSLIESRLKEDFDFILIDSTLDSIRVRSFVFRLHKIVLRIGDSIWKVLFSKADIVLLFCSSGLSFLEKGFVAMVGRLARKKVILFPRSGNTIHDVEGSWFYRTYVNVVIRCCKVLLCQSKYWQDFFSSLAPSASREKFKVIENWLPDSYFEQTLENEERHRWPLRLLYFNRIEREKGIYDFLEAMYILQKREVPVEASIFGDGKERERVQEYIKKNGLQNTRFEGWLNADKNRIIALYDIYIFASYAEGFPNALLEVMALGVPIISTRVGAVNDLIEPMVNGLLVNKGDPEGIAKAVQVLVNKQELLAQFSRKSLERVQGRNTLHIAVDSFKHVFDEV